MLMAQAVDKRTTPDEPLQRVETASGEGSAYRTYVISFLLVVIFVLLWEGLKLFGRANNYEIGLFGSTINLSIFNNTKLPHTYDIIKAFGEPAQRNGPPLIQELIKFGAFTLGEAVLGFAIGAVIGFILAVLFAHSSLMQRGVLPYVIASQTVPILAIAPMVVIWMRNAGVPSLAVPIIAAYLTFFPVTIYTLRGLTSVPQTSLELMQTYAASQWEILFKLRLPNALPQIFTALKISATASVVGAIIGELPSGIQDGLGIAILNFTQFYNQSPPRLWAAIVASALVGILFFSVVALVERFVIRWEVEESL
ncbi:MAG: ABC transporter permease [Chloroflexi bacterium]|nr:MAG: ABC transporter permease [Chloroflexota bacterium]